MGVRDRRVLKYFALAERMGETVMQVARPEFLLLSSFELQRGRISKDAASAVKFVYR